MSTELQMFSVASNRASTAFRWTAFRKFRLSSKIIRRSTDKHSARSSTRSQSRERTIFTAAFSTISETKHSIRMTATRRANSVFASINSAEISADRSSKDKVFFFTNYEGVRQTRGQTFNVLVPTQTFRNSAWSRRFVRLFSNHCHCRHSRRSTPISVGFIGQRIGDLREDTGSVKIRLAAKRKKPVFGAL